MKRRMFALIALLCGGLLAQEGHPMRGTWHGSWGTTATDRTSVTLVMDFDGDNVTGIMNPGLRSVPLQKVTLDPNGWKVHLEADYKDRAGAVSHLTVDAKLEEVTNVNRRMVGTYTLGTQKGDFKATRDN